MKNSHSNKPFGSRKNIGQKDVCQCHKQSNTYIMANWVFIILNVFGHNRPHNCLYDGWEDISWLASHCGFTNFATMLQHKSTNVRTRESKNITKINNVPNHSL